jgi:hypothetical protein
MRKKKRDIEKKLTKHGIVFVKGFKVYDILGRQK